MQLSETMPDTGEIELIRIAYNAEAALYCRGSRTEISLWSNNFGIIVAEEDIEVVEAMVKGVRRMRRS